MKAILWLFLLSLPLLLHAQSLTYERALGDGQARYEALDYEDAIKKFEAAKLLASTDKKRAEVNEWLNKAKDARLNALKYQLAVSDSLREMAIIEKERAEEEKQKADKARQEADSALNVINQVLDQTFFYAGRFGLTLKPVEWIFGNAVYRYGYIDRNGQEMIPFEFESATPFSIEDGYARVKMKEKKYLLDTLGRKYELAESLSELTQNIKGLDLHNSELQDLPTKIRELDLHYLNLQNNRLGEIPSEVINFKNIHFLNIRGNHINEISSEIEEIASLRTLDLSHNDLQKLPEQFMELRNLRILDLSYNNLEKLFPKTEKLSSLQFLDLSNNKFGELPPQLFDLTNLQYLNLSNNGLKKISSQISKLTNLKFLDLSKNNIEELPNQLFELENLSFLDLSNNNLSELTSEIELLAKLEYLNLHNNNLTSIPSEIGHLANLIFLDLGSYQGIWESPKVVDAFNEKPTFFRLRDIKSTFQNFGENNYHSQDEHQGNSIDSLSFELSQLAKLQFLNLGNNPLTKLPKQISKLKNLQTLDLRGTPLLEAEIQNLQSLLPNCKIIR